VTPQQAYTRLNKLLWKNRLPKAFVTFIDSDVMPTNYGITMWDEDFVLPVIVINAANNHWQRTLIHECLHVAEPLLEHGVIFDTLVSRYWRIARKEIKGLK
jgi:hypothetical protein